VVIETEVTTAKGESGSFKRKFNAADGFMVMDEAFSRNLPTRVDPVPFANGKGIPTQAYVTMRQMKLAGISFSDLKTVKMSNIQNVKSMIQLEHFLRQGMTPEQAVLRTHSVEYSETAIHQSGTQIVDVKITFNEVKEPVSYIADFQERAGLSSRVKNDEALTFYGVKRTDMVNWGFDIELKLSPLPAGVEAKPLGAVK
jgi:hypothetical protein